MGLSRLLGDAALRRVHVLPVEVPGHFPTRVAVEREAGERGWVLTTSPADTDVLAVCGQPEGSVLEAIDRIYDQLPGPRTRVNISRPQGTAAAFDLAASSLGDLIHQQHDARDRRGRDTEPGPTSEGPEQTQRSRRSEGHDDEAHGGHHRPQGDHANLGDPAGGDHGDHGMDLTPGGIPLAEGADDDRDGLEMDALHLTLGPVLPHWPAGLLLNLTLHGDLVAEASATMDPVDARSVGAAVPPQVYAAALRLDAVASLLSLAGWAAAAQTARAIRDGCLNRSSSVAVEVLRVHRRVARAGLLRWMLRGIGRVDQAVLAACGGSQAWAGDVWDRLDALLVSVERDLAGDTVPVDTAEALSSVLASAAPGLELASVRLLVASLAPGVVLVAREPTHA